MMRRSDDWLSLARVDEAEDIDNPQQPFDDVARSMSDLARTNALFGGTRTVLSHVKRLLRPVPIPTPLRILDIATGSGDIPKAVQAWARREGRPVTVVAVDNLASMLRLARGVSPETLLVQADARCLPFAPGTFDIALCALAFHHLGYNASVDVLRAMDALTTRGFVVSDLRRDRLSLWAVQAGLRLMAVHPFTRHDGPASVRRAWTPREYERMVGESGARGVRVCSSLHFRMALVQEKKEAPV